VTGSPPSCAHHADRFPAADRAQTFGELLIDLEEDNAAWTVVFGLLGLETVGGGRQES
jgi:hypothetical protein